MNFFMKSLIKSKLKGLPEDQIEKLISAIEKNPDFFKNIAKLVEEKTKKGMNQQDAIAEVLKDNQEDFKAVLN